MIMQALSAIKWQRCESWSLVRRQHCQGIFNLSSYGNHLWKQQ
jgi:hypothetical protein